MSQQKQNEAGHTPGPWKLDDVWMLILGPNGEEVCAIHSGEIDGNRTRLNRERAQENAALIASAPALLAQVETLKAREIENVKYAYARGVKDAQRIAAIQNAKLREALKMLYERTAIDGTLAERLHLEEDGILEITRAALDATPTATLDATTEKA